MAENPRPPATIRISRPWSTEKEFIDGDLARLGRTAIILPSSPPCETGELIRFEIVLANGTPVFRGEGHVIAKHPPGGTKPAGLEVRFTRIDARSKLIIDRVRERRTALSRQGSLAPGSVSLPPEGASLIPGPLVSQAPPLALESGSGASTPSVAKSGVRRTEPRAPVPPPPNRNEILEKLRVRAKELASAGGLSVKKR